LQEFYREAGRDARLWLREKSDRVSRFSASDEGVELHDPPIEFAIFALTLHQHLPYCEGDIRALNVRLVRVLPP
jgi:hypothetical protein